jgi:hypothetical protein
MRNPLAPSEGALPRLGVAGGLIALIWLLTLWAMA